MSPEMDLLEQLLGRDISLDTALSIFGEPPDREALARARRAIALQAQEGLIEVLRRSDEGERVLTNWEIRQALADDKEWILQSSAYFVRLTGKGVDNVT